MRKRRSETLELCELLPRLASEKGAERLRRPALEASVRRALGDWLGRHLISCGRDGSALELEMAGESAAGEAEALAGEVLAALRRRFGRDVPGRLRVVVGPAPTPRARPARTEPSSREPQPGPAASEALLGIEDPELRAQLARVAARATSTST